MVTEERSEEAGEARSHAGETAAPAPPPEGPVLEVLQFGSVVTREAVTVNFPGMDAKWYLTARAPDAAGVKRIEAAPYKFKDGDDGGTTLSPNAYALYLAKCEAQITDFCLPKLDEHGHLQGEVRFNHKFPGANKEVYDSFNEATLRFVEGALDQIGGRDTSAAEEYERLKNA